MNFCPDDFAAALKRAGLAEFFADCTDAHRREYLKWIEEAKRPETRKKRIEESLQRLSRKKSEDEAKRRVKK